MSQHDMNIANQGFPAFRADLNDALAALASTSTGATEPSTTFAQQLWYDSTANLLKMRNTDNDAWITLAYFDQTNDEWEIRSAVIQAVDSAGVVIKTDDGTTRLTIADSGAITTQGDLTVGGDLDVSSGTIKLDGNYPVGTNNVALGNAALDDGSLTGIENTAVGSLSLTVNTSGGTNTAMGYASLFANSTGSSNVAIGRSAMQSNTSASNNTAVGKDALFANTTGLENVAVGSEALKDNTTGGKNIAVGYATLDENTTGVENTAVGHNALAVNTTGSYNVAIGRLALVFNNASNNTAVGFSALYNNTASGNTAVGYNAAINNTSGTGNTAVGYKTLTGNTTGFANSAFGGERAGSAIAAMNNNTTGSYNSAFGVGALSQNTTASNNTAVGYAALISNTTASNNVAVGYQALRANTTGDFNTAIGRQAGDANTTGTYNTFLGSSSGYFMTTGSKNTILGRYNGNQGGLDIRTSSNNIVLSDGDGNPNLYIESSGRTIVKNANNGGALWGECTSASFTDVVLRARASRNTTNNTFYAFEYYNTGASALKCLIADSGNITNTNGSYGTISDVKIKQDIVDANSQWDDIKDLRFRKYRLKSEVQANPDAKSFLGLVAQEAELVSPHLIEEHIDRDEDGNDLGTVTKSIKTSVLYMKAVKALQEAMDRIETLETTQADLVARITALENQ